MSYALRPDHMPALACGFAHAAHLGQYDRDGRPHVEHVKRVVSGVNGRRTEPEMAYGQGYYTFKRLGGFAYEVVAAAWLHDVLEDTEATPELLATVGFSPLVIEVTRLLTRPEEPSYLDYVASIAEAAGPVGEIARLVKLADLEDNWGRSVAEGNDRAVGRYALALGLIRPAIRERGEQL